MNRHEYGHLQCDADLKAALERAEKAEARWKAWDSAYKYLFDGLMDIKSFSATPQIVEERAKDALREALDTLNEVTYV